MSKLKKLSLKTIGIILFCWFMLVALVTLEGFSFLPKTFSGWLLLIIFGPPAYIILEVVNEKVFGQPYNRFTNRLGEKKLKSINKVLIGIIITPLIILMLWGFYDWLF